MKHSKRILLLTFVALKLVDQPAPEVKINQGTLSGKISPDGTFYEYLGIPYATINSSSRFKAALPPPFWEGVYRATDEVYQCPQSTIVGVLGTEDCLKINVYVPAKSMKPLPVMVFIHGGTFVIGNGGKGLYGPDFLMQKDVILVTFNYRLGVLGFLCLGIKEAPGNAGLKDQIAALRWVKNNIAAFGGDPDNVTIFGLSAGAVSVSILLASQATEGLFNKAIIMSGVSTASWAINRQPLFTASLIAKELGYNTTDPFEIYKIFSRIPYKDLIEATPVKPVGKYFDFQLLNYPCVERSMPGEEAVLTDLPYDLLTKYSKNVSVMFGTTSKEGLMMLAYETKESLEERDSKYIFASDLSFESDEEAENSSCMVKKMYFGDKNISFVVHDAVQELYTHMYFEVPNFLEAEAILRTSQSAIYNYYFNYSGGRNFLKLINGYGGEKGACHGDELLYVFKGLAWPFPIKKNDQLMIDRMTDIFTNFAKYGNPNSITNLQVHWEPSTKDDIKLLYIDDDLKMGTLPNPKAYKLWKDIYTKHRKRHQAPQPAPSWNGVFRAIDEIYQCPQNTPFGVVGTEDCLKINVYVPVMARKPLPVMVYIHGGAFVLGSGGKLVYAPDFIVKHDVIMVTFNYRLGPFGFLCLNTKEAPGNAGMKDQVAALRWVKKNIANFGGNPDSVTIFGHSAGGISVALLVASDTTEGLFQRAIIQSGSSLTNWAVNRNPVLVASKLAKLLGFNLTDSENLYNFYSTISYTDLIAATASIPVSKQITSGVLHLPCIEKSFPGVESFLQDLPYNLLMRKPKNITLMYGTMEKEGLFFISEETDDSLEMYNRQYFLADDLIFKSKEEENKVAENIWHFYFGNELVNRKTIMNLSELYTDLYFKTPMTIEAELIAKSIEAPIYFYYFTYSGGRNMVKNIYGFANEPGACHGDDILYMFKPKIWPYKISEEDQKIIDWMTETLTNFAKYGNPTPDFIADVPIRWLPNDKQELRFMHIGDELRMGPLPKLNGLRLWKDIYEKYRHI